MNDEQPHHDDAKHAARPAGPTLAEFREYLLDNARQSPLLGNVMLRAVVNVIDSYSADQAAAVEDTQADALSRKYLRFVARTYRNTQHHEHGRSNLLDDLAAEFDLVDIRILRLAAEAAVAATPRAIKAARDRGMTPPQIADELALTPSRVYAILREQRDADSK
ncbi:hypothetical protein ACIGW3_11370 [Streptomyces sp. NPDC053499]|uniref:hypothetical protein n=1 Tax=Streptomyces sp. NPDC053499 TaxID=3365707 RepID=UPI0037D7764B